MHFRVQVDVFCAYFASAGFYGFIYHCSVWSIPRLLSQPDIGQLDKTKDKGDTNAGCTWGITTDETQ